MIEVDYEQKNTSCQIVQLSLKVYTNILLEFKKYCIAKNLQKITHTKLNVYTLSGQNYLK